MGPATPRRAFGDPEPPRWPWQALRTAMGECVPVLAEPIVPPSRQLPSRRLHEERPAMLHGTVKGRGGSLAAGLQKGRRVESFRTQGVDAQDRHAVGNGDYQLLDPRIDSSSSS
jgi:hypothetical protein